VETWPSQGKVSFQDVELRYRPTTEKVLQGLSFEVAPGTKVGVVGRTGAGKSTLSLAISRIVELCGGKIEIDGVDIGKIELAKLRQKVTVIPQDPTLFTGTLRFNLDPFGAVSDEVIRQLLSDAGLDDLLNRDKQKVKPEDKANEPEPEQ